MTTYTEHYDSQSDFRVLSQVTLLNNLRTFSQIMVCIVIHHEEKSFISKQVIDTLQIPFTADKRKIRIYGFDNCFKICRISVSLKRNRSLKQAKYETGVSYNTAFTQNTSRGKYNVSSVVLTLTCSLTVYHTLHQIHKQ